MAGIYYYGAVEKGHLKSFLTFCMLDSFEDTYKFIYVFYNIPNTGMVWVVKLFPMEAKG